MLSAFNVCCRYSSVLQTSLLSWSWKQSLWSRIRLILWEQSYLGLLQWLLPKNIIRLKRTKLKCQTGGKRGKFVYLACSVNPLKGPELRALKILRERLSLECFGQVWLKSFSIFTYTEPTVRIHRLMCIFFISRFQSTFSHEVTVVSEIYCQNFKDKTSIYVLGKLLKCVSVA